jgi:hypothetical protein
MGFAATMGIRLDQLGRGGRILLIEDRDRSADRILEALNRSTMSSVRPIRPGPASPSRRQFGSSDRQPHPGPCRRPAALLAGGLPRHDAGDSVLREFAALCAALFAASTSLAGSGERNSWRRCIPISPKPISSASACVSASPRHPSMPARGCGDARSDGERRRCRPRICRRYASAHPQTCRSGAVLRKARRAQSGCGRRRLEP